MFQLSCRICLEQRSHSELASVFSMHNGFVIHDTLLELFDLEIGQAEMLTSICNSCLTKVSTARNIREWFSKQNLKYQQLVCDSEGDPQADTNASNASHSMAVEDSAPMVESTTQEEQRIIEDDVEYILVSAEDETISCTDKGLVYDCAAQDDVSGGDSDKQQTEDFQVQLIDDDFPAEQECYQIIQLTEESAIEYKEIMKNPCYFSIDDNTFLGRIDKSEDLLAQSEEELVEEESATSVGRNRRETAERRDEYECSLCGMRFGLEVQLIDHGIETHGDRFELFQCEFCGIQFASQRSQRRHRCNVEGKFQCRYCEKKLTTRNAWKGHQNMHLQEQSFQCDLCERKFSQYSSMRRHRLVHTDDKPYECEFCHRNFRQRGVLLAHRRRHTGEKPYSCDVCGKAFREHSALAKHKTLHNRDHLGKGKAKRFVSEAD